MSEDLGEIYDKINVEHLVLDEISVASRTKMPCASKKKKKESIYTIGTITELRGHPDVWMIFASENCTISLPYAFSGPSFCDHAATQVFGYGCCT